MSTLVVRLGEGAFVVWSDTIDAPVSSVLGRADLVEFLSHGADVAPAAAIAAVAAAELSGTSDPQRDLADVIASNRAGPGETHLEPEEIITAYSSAE